MLSSPVLVWVQGLEGVIGLTRHNEISGEFAFQGVDYSCVEVMFGVVSNDFVSSGHAVSLVDTALGVGYA